MDAQEQLILDVVIKVSSGVMDRKQGQQIVGVSERTFRRYLAEYGTRGALFIKHGNCRNIPLNRSPQELKSAMLALVQERYFDFNLTHCLEKLQAEHGLKVGRETFRKWCHEIRMVKRAKRRRGAKVRRHRDRMQQTGMMLQMDGSHHCWFGGKPSCLIAAIDDADSDVPFAEFFTAEDTISCMRVLQRIIEKKGLFQILYVDKAGIFGGGKRANFSQVKRALGELGIHIIFAQSPEAKGRIERLWGTLQDRLIPEMRLRGIRSYETANSFLQNQFIPDEYARKFRVQPLNPQTVYKPVPTNLDLKEIFCLKEHRMCRRDHTLSWNNQLYRIESPLKFSIYRQTIEIRTYQDGSWRAFFGGLPIEVSQVEAPVRAPVAAQPAATAASEVIPLHTVKVRQDGHVMYKDRYYSVAESHIGEKVSVIEKDGQVAVYKQGKVIEEHALITAPGKLNSTKEHHLEPWRKAQREDSPYRRRARAYGAYVDELVCRVIQRGCGFVDTATIWGILGFDQAYPAAALNQACQHALELELPTYRAVKIFLRLQGKHPSQKASS